jgi:16S rRNA (uracil1498-N3)-methyltransferase
VKLIAWCDETLSRGISSFYTSGQSILVLIGPEGDFTPEEVKMTIDKGFHPVSLGVNRLRTETAAVVACSHIQFINTFAP